MRKILCLTYTFVKHSKNGKCFTEKPGADREHGHKYKLGLGFSDQGGRRPDLESGYCKTGHKLSFCG